MRYEHRELIDTLQDLRRDAVGCLKAFTNKNGALRHHPDAPSEARKTTLRAAQFFLDFPTKTIEAKEQVDVKLYATTSMAKTVLSAKTSSLYDKEWALMLHPFDPINKDSDNYFIQCIKYVEKLGYLRETGEVDPSWDYGKKSTAWPHTIFFYLFDRVVDRFQIARRSPGIDLKTIRRRIWNRCAEELHKQCAVFSADAMGYFDAAKMAFALAPALNVVPAELVDNALKICADKLADSPNQIFSPYWIVTRDKYYRPLLEEVIAALLDGALQLLERRRTTLTSIDSIARLLHVVAERALVRKRTTPEASGWTAVDGPHPPEAWPTLAVAEFAANGEAFLRRYTLFRLRAQYRFQVRRADRARVDWSEYRSLPFGVHAGITANMLTDGGNWRSAVLFGPPGTGKTSMVHAIAKERGWDLVIITPADVAQDGPDRIIARARELLEGLSDAERVIVFLDEFEPFVRLRDGEEEEMWMSMITNSMLPLLQELRDRSEIYCFLATNYVTKIDPAATREGRFDAVLPIWPPDRDGRRALIAASTAGTVLGDDLDQAAMTTKGCTTKELRTMCERNDRKWSAGSCAEVLPKFQCELERARPTVAAKFD